MDRRKLLSSLGLGAIAVFATPVVLSISSARASTGSSGGGSSGGSDGGSSSGGSDSGSSSGGSDASGPSSSSSGGTPSAGTGSVADLDDEEDEVAPVAASGSCIVGMNCQ